MGFSARRLLKRLRQHRIAVILGGTSTEREISLQTGRAVKEALEYWSLKPRAIDAKGNWIQKLKQYNINFAYLALHGSPGEDGTIQGMFDVMGIPYTGSKLRASALAMDKPVAKTLFKHHGIPTAPWQEFSKASWRQGALDLTLPVVVKPAEQGSALGVTIVKKSQELSRALSHAFSFDPRVLIEKFVPGTEITVGILGAEPLPVVEIVPSHSFYDFYSKYRPGGSRHVVPARLPQHVLSQAQKTAVEAFHVLGCRAYGRVDLIVAPSGWPIVLEVNTIS